MLKFHFFSVHVFGLIGFGIYYVGLVASHCVVRLAANVFVCVRVFESED